ncbi:MAG: 4-hydroxy-3-methylbut-2-enyl diphosphate reductase [Bacteroidetes bacterium]|nr:MAG: 4-hydroxy-3-methylbut-2-enyl diphosphate reductase [Bacteroidota bacterium]
MKQFNVPSAYRSPLISAIKNKRRLQDKLKKDFSPTRVDFGPVVFLLARHFGFCYGVENAIEIAYRCIEENPGKRIFLLSEMIHNPTVNADLQALGLQFLQDTYGRPLIPLESVTSNDVVIIPAFGTTLAMEKMLAERGIAVEQYNTTCPFVEKVWNRGEALASKGYSLVVHGKPTHEETRATFSRSAANAATVIVNNMAETVALGLYITGQKPVAEFYAEFEGRYSTGFDASKDLQRLGVINQTTQLATDTQAIADYLKNLMVQHFGLTEQNTAERFADTRDTLCYATNDNQTAVVGLLEHSADLAIVVGGYNSSNTSHLVELCEHKLPTYYISSDEEITSATRIKHFDWRQKQALETEGYLPQANGPVTIMLTSGASCPDAMVEAVMGKLAAYFDGAKTMDEVKLEWLNPGL